ncbi:MAG: exodeoxyribonuclease III [Candidatus Nanoarchaeia archaeon]|jgi:exodeoxyribonuclease-3|nr:exodeoxyribonuclease III [Candidatus Nanoarchaeia archaeon]
MKIISWNVNGIRAVLKKGFSDFVHKTNPDILCLQETKAHPDQVDKMLDNYEHHYWNSADKKGYSGTAVFSKIKPLKVVYGGGLDEGETEGRVIMLEYDDFYLVNVYTPNSQRGLTRLTYRQKWDRAFLKYLKELEKEKPVVLCGDLNVAHKEIDLARPKNNKKNAGFTEEERKGMDNYVKAGFVDTFRMFTEKGGHYSWWSYMFNSRAKDVGWRIDYFIVSGKLKSKVENSRILKMVMGSDHAPVELKINI